MLIHFFNFIFRKEGEDISGLVNINLGSTKSFSHNGVRIELVGHIGKMNFSIQSCLTIKDLYYDKKQCSDFTVIARELEPIGQLTQDKSYKFIFK